MKSIILYLGGNGPCVLPEHIDLATVTKVLAADSGIELAQQHNIKTDLLVGDLDSISKNALASAKESGVEILSYNKDKDQTDFELALEEVKKIDIEHLIIIGGGGQRTDHLLANLSVLAGTQTKEYFTDIYLVEEILYVCRSNQPRKLKIENGSTVSLIPINGSVSGVTTIGFKWELENATLDSSYSLGVSNINIKEHVEIEIKSGFLLIVVQNNY